MQNEVFRRHVESPVITELRNRRIKQLYLNFKETSDPQRHLKLAEALLREYRDKYFKFNVDKEEPEAWITVRGTHIPINESGTATGGPLKGQNFSQAKSEKKASIEGKSTKTPAEIVKLITQNERKVYGKIDGQSYKSVGGNEVEQECYYNELVGDKKVRRYKSYTFAVPPNEETDSLHVHKMKGIGGFVDGKYMIDDTQNSILSGGRIALSDAAFNEDTGYKIQGMVTNEIYALAGIRKEGVFYRVTANSKEPDIIKEGKIRKSVNHATGEQEDGLSVWEVPKYTDKHLERVTGKVISIGSDGEPILDCKTVKLIGVDDIDTKDMWRVGKERFKEAYDWTDEQLQQALHGGFKKIS